MPRFDDSVAYAANWRAVLAADAGSGVVVGGLGILLLATIHVVVGALIAAVGAAYLVLVARRARHWTQLRREAGL